MHHRFLSSPILVVWLLSALSPANAIMLVSEKMEIQIGQEVAANAEKEYGGALPKNHPDVRWVRSIADNLTPFKERENIPYSFNVLDNDEVVNAFAAPGGPIYITHRLVKMCERDDGRLAFILGHEIGHIEAQHGRKAINKGILAQLGFQVLFGKSSEAVQLGVSIAWGLIERGHSRDQESEADRYGVRFMHLARYNPWKSVEALKMLDPELHRAKGLDKYLATHPDIPHRIDQVSEQIRRDYPDARPGGAAPVKQPAKRPAPPKPAKKPAPQTPQPRPGHGSGYLLRTIPGGAEVRLGNRVLGRTAPDGDDSFRSFNVAPGRHRLEIRLDGYETRELIADEHNPLGKGEWRKLEIRLRRLTQVRLTVETSRGLRVSRVEVDGRTVGSGPGPHQVHLQPGWHRVRAVLAGRALTGRFEVPDRATADIRVQQSGNSLH